MSDLTRQFAAVVLVLCLSAPGAALTRPADSPPRETVKPVSSQAIANLPGKRLVSVTVDYPPGAASLPHRHAPSAFIYAYVISGAIRSAVDGEPARVYRAGEGWFEQPGAHHRVSENASDRRSARLLAVFIVDEKDQQLTTPDHR